MEDAPYYGLSNRDFGSACHFKVKNSCKQHSKKKLQRAFSFCQIVSNLMRTSLRNLLILVCLPKWSSSSKFPAPLLSATESKIDERLAFDYEMMIILEESPLHFVIVTQLCWIAHLASVFQACVGVLVFPPGF